MIKRTKDKIISVIAIIILLISMGMQTIGAELNKSNITLNHNEDNDRKNVFMNNNHGYVLFAPEYHKNTFLIDKDGREVKVWESNYWQVLGTYLMENGNLLRTCSKIPNPVFPFGGFTGRVEMYDWNGSLVWEFDYSDNNVCLHHDVEVLPNGNILMIAWENKNAQEAIEAGVNPDLITSNKICPDHIIEVEPIFPKGGNIVWEWHVWDHLIQEYDATKQNFGMVEEHPELIDVNYVNYSDITHMNSIDYHAEYDQILLSVRHYNEIWLIDHSTTTQQAAGHTGGRYGKGGDLLYRWGNPQIYQRGDLDDQKFFFQHDARWIEQGYSGEGNILVFNNGLGRPSGLYTSVEEIIPPMDENGSYILGNDEPYGPASPSWVYIAEEPTDFYVNHLSGAQRLPNGNTLICNGPEGYFFEVTMEQEMVWSYENTITESDINPLSDDFFTIQYYPINYTGIGPLEYQDPEKPMKPEGETLLQTGKQYEFSTSTTDPNGDTIVYFFDWGDGSNSGWLGPYASGAQISTMHSYRETGFYQIKVKSKDMDNFEGQWSDALEVYVELSEVWLFGKIDSISVKDSEISFWADKLFMISFNPFSFELYPLGVYMVVDDDYMGILTKNIIAGKFYRKD